MCSVSFITIVTILTSTPLGSQPSTWTSTSSPGLGVGRPAFTFPWDSGKSETLDSWLGFYKVRIIWPRSRSENIHTVAPAWSSLDSTSKFPSPNLCPWGRAWLPESCKGLLAMDCIWNRLWGARGRRSVRVRKSCVSCCPIFSQAAFSQDTHPLPVPSLCLLHPSSMSVLFLKRLRTSQNTATLHPHPSLGACWDAWPWLESFSGFTASSAVIAVSILQGTALAGSSWCSFGLIYLLAFTIAGQLHDTMCFLSLGFYENFPAFSHSSLGFRFIHLPQNVLSPGDFRTLFFFSTMSISLLESDLHLPGTVWFVHGCHSGTWAKKHKWKNENAE